MNPILKRRSRLSRSQQEYDARKHEYFEEHQCHLPPEKVNTFQVHCSRFRQCILNLTAVNLRDIRAQKLYRSYSTLCAERYRQYSHYPFSIHPYSTLRFWIEVVLVIGIICSNMILAIHYSQLHPHGQDSDMTVMYTFDLLYLAHIVINFLTGYVEGKTHQYVVLDFKKIACQYAKTWLVVDVLTIFYFIPGLMKEDDVYLQFILMSMKISRLPVLMVYLNNILTVMRAGFLQKTLMESFCLIVSYLSWNIFFQFSVEYVIEGSFFPDHPRRCSWLSFAKLWNSSVTTRFTYALDRSVGMLRKNSNINVIEEGGCFESFFIVAWVIAKLLIYHCTLKFIVALFGLESAKGRYAVMTKQVETLMNQRKFPPRIKKKILKFYAIRFQSNFFAEARMQACMTGQLREDIIMHTGRQLVRELNFLKKLPRSLLLQIGLKLKIVVFIAGDIIFKINTIGDCLYFIDKGTVAIYSESGSEICHLEDGDYFGEIALVMKRCIRTASAVAVTNCELFRLDKDDFDSSIALYPTIYENIKKEAISRFERTCVLDEHHKVELKIEEEHNRKNMISELIDPSMSGD